jgi:hypothetical protein
MEVISSKTLIFFYSTIDYLIYLMITPKNHIEYLIIILKYLKIALSIKISTLNI